MTKVTDNDVVANNVDLFPILSAAETAKVFTTDNTKGKHKEAFNAALDRLEVGGSTWVSRTVLCQSTIKKYCKERGAEGYKIRASFLNGKIQGFYVKRLA